MTISDLRCDRCGSFLAGPGGVADGLGRRAVRFAYHPGSPHLKDDSGLVCESCWADMSGWLGAPTAKDACAVCASCLDEGRLVVYRPGELVAWPLCRSHAVEFLNALRTVEPKLDASTFAFPSSQP